MTLPQSWYVQEWPRRFIERHLFTGGPPVSRAGNPATSHQAEASINRRYPGSIRNALALNAGLSDYEASKRLSDLERLGKIRKGPPRRAADTGRMQSTWWSVRPEI